MTHHLLQEKAETERMRAENAELARETERLKQDLAEREAQTTIGYETRRQRKRRRRLERRRRAHERMHGAQ